MAALLEHEAKALLARHGVAVPRGRACASAAEAARFAEDLAGPVVVKALVPAKGKQMGGGIHFASSPADASRAAASLIGTRVGGFPVEQVLVEARESVVAEIYASIALDGAAKAYRLTVACKGGAGVESELAHGGGRSLLFRPGSQPWPYEVRDLLLASGVRGKELRFLPDAIVGLCAAALAADATLLEVNPVGVLADDTACAIGVLVSLDESALHRHPDLAAHALLHVDQLMRPATAWEQSIDALNQALPDGGDIRFGEFPDGDIGMMVLGGGAGLMALDAVSLAGGRPANFFDMTSTTGRAEEKVYRAVKLFLGIPRLRGLLVGSNIGAFLPVPVRLRGIARALREGLPARGRFPVVIRLAGVGDDDPEIEQLLAGLPVTYLRDEVTLDDAVAMFMEQVGRSA